ncbi:MAG: S41 family peptidase [Pseudobdellovibrionaceae bacterium]
MKKMMRWLKVSVVGFIVIAVISFFLQINPKAFAEDRYADLQNFSKVLNLIQQYYVESVDIKKLIYGAIKGMLRELDPHSSFMTPEIFKDFERETGGEFGGIGIEISIQNGVLTIISPIEDTPAWKAGVKAGDKVIAIDGKSTKNASLAEASQMMRGKKGAKITLRMLREGVDAPIDIVIVRGNVRVKSVKYTDLENGYAYIRITSFIENTAEDLEKMITKHNSQYPNAAGLLIDLRKNPGGLLEQAVKISDMFLKDGVIVSTISRDPKQKEITSATKTGKYTAIPILILVDEYSASASEIVSGALQDNNRALVVGERTFGKGSVQSVVKLGDGSALKLTVARYYTPSGVSIQAEGIHPDVILEDISADETAVAKGGRIIREKDIAGHLRGDQEKDDKEDVLKDRRPDAAKKLRQANLDAFEQWKLLTKKEDKLLSVTEKLVKSDFQAYQAINYLKTWSTLKK